MWRGNNGQIEVYRLNTLNLEKGLQETLPCPGWVAHLESHPVHQKGLGFDPQSGHVPRLGHVQEATNQCFSHIDESVNMSSGEDWKKKDTLSWRDKMENTG